MTKTLLCFLLTLVMDDIDLLASTLGREGDTGGLPLSKFTGGGSMVENVEAATIGGKKIILSFYLGCVTSNCNQYPPVICCAHDRTEDQ